MKKLIITHGDKGGVGKSTIAMAIIEYLIANEKPVTIVDGDVNVSDIAMRYANHKNCKAIIVDLDKSGEEAQDASILLFRHIEDIGNDFVILNMPANSSKILDEYGEFILEVSKELGYEVSVIWMIGKDESSARLSAACNICDIADRKIAVVNRYDGKIDDNYYWFREPKYYQSWVDEGGYVAEMPLMSKISLRMIKGNLDKSLVDLINSNEVNTSDKIAISSWLRKTWSSIMPAIMGEGHHEQSK